MDGGMLGRYRDGHDDASLEYLNVTQRVSHQKLVGFPTGFRASSFPVDQM